MEDRFGEIPQTVQDLLTIAYIRGQASMIPLASITEDEGGYSLFMVPERVLSPETLVALSRDYPRGIKINAGKKPHIKLLLPPSMSNLRDRLIQLEEIVEKLYQLTEGQRTGPHPPESTEA